MEKIKLTNHQLFSLTANGAIGGSVVIMPSILAGIAKQDAWIAALITPAFGIPVIWVMLYLSGRYPGMTFVAIIKKILGRRIGFVVAASYVFLCLFISCHLPWYVGNFVTSQAMPETPEYIIRAVFVAVMVAALLYGIEAMARASELFVYFVSVLFFLSMLFVSPNIKIENIQPVLERGIIPSFKASFILSSILTFPLFTLLMIYPVNVTNIKKAKAAINKGYLLASLIIFVSILMTILVLGSGMTSRARFPTYILAKEIDVGVIFSRLEFVIIIIWIATEFTIGTLFFYAGATGLSQLLGLKDYKRVVLPLGLIVLVLSGVVLPDAIYQESWFSLVWVPYSATYGLVLPVLLLIISLIRRPKSPSDTLRCTKAHR